MMKRIIFFWVLPVICASVAFSDIDFDNVISGSTEYNPGTVRLEDETLLVTGSGAYRIETREESYVEVWGTSPLSNSGGIMDILLDDESDLLYLGGETDLIFMDEDATATLKGGHVNYINSLQHAIIGELYGVPIYNKHITLECRPDWSWLYTSGDITGITGLWADSTTFTINFIDDEDYDPVFENINVVEIPEPATLALLSLGALLIRRKK